MDTGLHSIELKGFAGVYGRLTGWRAVATVKYFKLGLVGLPLALIAGFGAWMLASGYSSNTAESEPVRLASAVTESVPASIGPQGGSLLDPAPAAVEGAPAQLMPPRIAPLGGLRMSSQTWRRGGLGSKALVTFTLRNRNDYAVKNVEILCAFSRRDGSHLTARRRVIPDTVQMKSQRIFARMLVGFVHIGANSAKCQLVDASRA